FNGDGKQDLVTADEGPGNISVLLGNGNGSFGPATNFAVGAAPESVAIGDFNGDGKQDLVTANSYSPNVSVLLGTGTGSFGTAINFAAGQGPAFVAVGDFNGDGRQDLAVANDTSDSQNISVLLNTCQPPETLIAHVTWQGRPAQPNPAQSAPLTLTLKSNTTE